LLLIKLSLCWNTRSRKFSAWEEHLKSYHIKIEVNLVFTQLINIGDKTVKNDSRDN
jgi:hypothetical protein